MRTWSRTDRMGQTCRQVPQSQQENFRTGGQCWPGGQGGGMLPVQLGPQVGKESPEKSAGFGVRAPQTLVQLHLGMDNCLTLQQQRPEPGPLPLAGQGDQLGLALPLLLEARHSAGRVIAQDRSFARRQEGFGCGEGFGKLAVVHGSLLGADAVRESAEPNSDKVGVSKGSAERVLGASLCQQLPADAGALSRLSGFKYLLKVGFHSARSRGVVVPGDEGFVAGVVHAPYYDVNSHSGQEAA